MRDTITIDDFEKVDMRIGKIIAAEINKKAKKPAYKLTIDFGGEIGVKTSSAQLTELYGFDELIGTQIIVVVNFPPRKVADVLSEVLVLGCDSGQGIVLIRPDRTVEEGILIL